MMKKVCLVALMVLVWMFVQASDFMIGAYAQYDLWKPGAMINRGTLRAKLMQAGYNAVKVSVQDDDLNNLDLFTSTMGSDVKTILEDQYWSPSSGKAGIHSLTYGNYLKMEAEYMYAFDPVSHTFTPDPLVTPFLIQLGWEMFIIMFSPMINQADIN